MNSLILQKTDKARAELRPGHRTLGQRERTVLLLADGTKTIQDMVTLFDGDGRAIAEKLLNQGYLHGGGAEVTAVLPPERPVLDVRAKTRANSSNVQNAADQFEGRRSLATTRMFLFDLTERMFARRDPAMAEVLRQALRDAKDRESMIDTSRVMLTQIEHLAGVERADSISQRIAMLLPAEDAAAA